MADELFNTLMRFHREVVQPELDDIRAKMVTKDGLQAMRGEMATKVDLEAIRAEMATKVDLEAIRAEMATKVDLEAMRGEMATKVDLEVMRAEMATKVDLEAIRREMVTWPVLMRYHQEIVRPEVEEVRSKLADLATRDEMLSHVDGLYVRFGILDSEYHALSAAVRRIEEQMAQQTVDIGEVRSELVKINDQISRLAQRVTNLETVLN